MGHRAPCVSSVRNETSRDAARHGRRPLRGRILDGQEEMIAFDGLVTEILPDARYRVQLDNGHEIVAYTSGKMKKNRIKTLTGDRVTVEMSPYDLEKARLVFRHKDERAGPPPAQDSARRSAAAEAHGATSYL